MAGASGIRAGAAFVELFADDSRLQRGLKAASKRLKDWGNEVSSIGKKMLAAGSVALGGAFAVTKSFAKAGDDLAKASQRMGIPVEMLSALSFAAERSGASFEDVEKGVRTMQKRLGAAAAGGGEARQAFEALGLSVDSLLAMRPDEQFMAIADRIAAIPDPALKTTSAMAAFGRQGAAMLPLFAEGAGGIRALVKEAKDLGIVMSTDDANAAVSWTDTMTNLTRVLHSVANVIGATLARPMEDFANRVIPILANVRAWARENAGLIRSAFQLAGALVAVGAATFAVGKVLRIAGALVGGLGTGLRMVGLLGKAVAGVFSGAILPVLGALLTPVGLLSAAVVGLGGYLLATSETGQRAIAWLGDMFGSLLPVFSETWGGIVAAIQKGDLGQAVAVAWGLIKWVWAEGVSWITKKWAALASFLGPIFFDAMQALVPVIVWLEHAWVDVVWAMRRAWLWLTGGIERAWSATTNWLAKKMLQVWGWFDKSLDVAGAMKALDEDALRRQQERARSAQAELAAITQEREAGHAALVGEEGRLRAAIQAQRDNLGQALQGQVTSAEQAAEDARKAWQDAIAAAKQPLAEGVKEAAKMPEVRAGVLGGLGAAERRVAAMGTFNPFGAMGIGANSPIERTARATETVAKNTDALVKLAREQELEFD
jgi:hypothetical protein